MNVRRRGTGNPEPASPSGPHDLRCTMKAPANPRRWVRGTPERDRSQRLHYGSPLASRGSHPVKLIIAIIQPNKLESVKEALSEVEVFRLTVLDVQGFGRQRGHAETYRGHEIAVNLLRKVQLQIAVNDDFVEPTIAAIIKGGRSGETGEIGDGKIFVLPLEECVRIRTGERGHEAI